MTVKLKSSLQVAEELGKSRQWIDWAIKNYALFPKPFATIDRYKGWTDEQIKNFNKGVEWKEDTIELKSSRQVTKALGMSRQWIDWAVRHDKLFPEPFAMVNKYKGWSQEQLDEYIKKKSEIAAAANEPDMVEDKEEI